MNSIQNPLEPTVPTSDATAFTRLRRGLGGGTDGLRTPAGLYRFFGRNAWEWPISLNIHLFADDINQQEIEQSWRIWLDKVLG